MYIFNFEISLDSVRRLLNGNVNQPINPASSMSSNEVRTAIERQERRNMDDNTYYLKVWRTILFFIFALVAMLVHGCSYYSLREKELEVKKSELSLKETETYMKNGYTKSSIPKETKTNYEEGWTKGDSK